ncbi:MAG: hypothetical protein PHS86_03090 [Syntrophaceae bacterium]|nr:hypothetical protein [Syntrophaceae bacterium]
MKTLKVFLFSIICLVLFVPVADAARTEKISTTPKTVYNKQYQCVMVCQGERPALETLETGLAYLLDIPLALISPITCPVVTPLLEKYDSGPDRTYYKQTR